MSVDDEQQPLGEPEAADPRGYPWDPQQYATELREIVGVEPDHFGAQPQMIAGDVGPEDDWWRFQVEREYWYFTSTPEKDDTPIAGIQFRAIVHTVNEPPLAIQNHLRRRQLDRVPTMFNTGPPEEYEGYLEGFFGGYTRDGPPGYASPVNTESSDISQQEARNIGIVEWYAEVYDEEGNLRGKANGFADPFAERGEEAPPPPANEVWSVHWTPSRGTYEIRPPHGASRTRLAGLPKKVYINGLLVGKTKPGGTKRGIVELTKEYGPRSRPPYIDGNQPVDRAALIDAGMNYQEIQDGGKVYKIDETADAMSFVSSQRRLPPGFDPIDPDEVDPEATGALFEWLDLVGDDESTLFDVRYDEVENWNRPALGYHDAPTDREIVEQTIFDFPDPWW